jgi:hypothetical protein
MTNVLKVQILTNHALEYEAPLTTVLEIGRQRQGEPGPYTHLPATTDAPARLVVAVHEESYVSRRHMILEYLASFHAVQVINRSKVAIPINNGTAILAGDSLGSRCIRVIPNESADQEAGQTVGDATLALGAVRDGGNAVPDIAPRRSRDSAGTLS